MLFQIVLAFSRYLNTGQFINRYVSKQLLVGATQKPLIYTTQAAVYDIYSTPKISSFHPSSTQHCEVKSIQYSMQNNEKYVNVKLVVDSVVISIFITQMVRA